MTTTMRKPNTPKTGTSKLHQIAKTIEPEFFFTDDMGRITRTKLALMLNTRPETVGRWERAGLLPEATRQRGERVATYKPSALRRAFRTLARS